jgi:signal transduction histidine kinase
MRCAANYNREHDLVLELVDVTSQIAEDNLGKIAEELTDNAFKFSEAGTPVRVASSYQDGQFCLQISDGGHGMNEENIAHIGAYIQFERKLYEQQGSGLGLTLARKITELYGGQLSVESAPNKGTTVTVHLPLAEHSSEKADQVV